MTDIVEWLRDKSSEHNMYRCDEAADRIEQLEAALRVICDGPRDADKSYPELLAEIRCEARAALECM
jgi:hypothetical protein